MSLLFMEMITIERDNRLDWATIRAEYIGGGTSYRKLADKYRVSRTTLMKRAKAVGWVRDREEARAKGTAKAIQITADAAADNAVRLERARALMIDKIISALEHMPDDGGSRTRITDYSEKDEARQRDYDLLALATVIEKLSRFESGKGGADDPLTKLLQRLNDESAE